jgi:hypothetical protein
VDEAAFIEALLSDLVKLCLKSKDFPIKQDSHSDRMVFIGKEFKGKIGIITPYKS